jgi:hypothetical protein
MYQLNMIDIQNVNGGAEGAAGRLGHRVGEAVGVVIREIIEHGDESICEVIGMWIAGNHENYHS